MSTTLTSRVLNKAHLRVNILHVIYSSRLFPKFTPAPPIDLQARMDVVERPIDMSEINPQPFDETAEDDLDLKHKLPGELCRLHRVACHQTFLQNWCLPLKEESALLLA